MAMRATAQSKERVVVTGFQSYGMGGLEQTVIEIETIHKNVAPDKCVPFAPESVVEITGRIVYRDEPDGMTRTFIIPIQNILYKYYT